MLVMEAIERIAPEARLKKARDDAKQAGAKARKL